jgi:hypothetical protein
MEKKIFFAPFGLRTYDDKTFEKSRSRKSSFICPGLMKKKITKLTMQNVINIFILLPGAETNLVSLGLSCSWQSFKLPE